ncbi:MAG: DNA translocase FtsK [Parasporobacterium sp.]|nr:DNA translocase FtsK [Parasporobacterium sp.]
MGFFIALFLELCNFDVFGTFGGWLKTGMFGIFGAMAYLFPVLLLLMFIVSSFEEKRTRIMIAGITAFLFICAFSHLVSSISLNNHNVLSYFSACSKTLSGGGVTGGALALVLYSLLSHTGAVILCVLIILVCLFFIFEDQVKKVFAYLSEKRDEEKYHEKDDRYYEPAPAAKSKKAVPARPQEEYYDDYADYNENSYYEEPEYYDEPVKRRNKDKTLCELTDDNGKVIRLVRRKKVIERVHSAPLTRTARRASTMRSTAVDTVRSNNKARGVSSKLDMIPGTGPSDEIHEITRKKTSEPAKKDRRISISNTEKEYSQLSFTEEQLNPSVPPVRRETEKINRTSVPGNEHKAESIKNTAPSGKTAVSRSDNSGRSGSAPVQAPSHIGNKPSGNVLKPAARAVKGGYCSPSVDLLAEVRHSSGQNTENLESVADDLEIILNQFGVHATVTNIQAGPSVTRFELQPEIGTRVNKITQLADDLKLNLGVTEIRIEAPIPGSKAVGIEIPNKNRQTVYMRELLQDVSLINHPSKIAFAAGKDISGNVIVADIAKMPHLLVAGTTGSGKSVFLNSILMTILYRAKPSEVGLIIIDPKKVEFGVYAGIPHLMRDVVTDPGQAVSTLRWAVNEMTNRYQRMQMSAVRDFRSYNAKVEKGTVSADEENPRKMNQIVIIIDELADLMMVAKKEAEALICRLAQLARAAGIHLIIATQRPSVDVVTGLIKANVPARVALLVSSAIDSRTIIDMQGAEKLLGYGDMLFYPTGYVKPVRIQGAFVSDDEIQNTVDYLISNNTNDYYAAESLEIEKFMNSQAADSTEGAASEEKDAAGKYDECFYEAGKMCIEMGKASSSMLQRRFNLGFNRAARIIDQLQEFGVVGQQNGAKPREILVDSMTFEEMWDSFNDKG